MPRLACLLLPGVVALSLVALLLASDAGSGADRWSDTSAAPRSDAELRRVGLPPDAARWPRAASGPGPAQLHCICGPDDVPDSERGCAPVFENVTAFVEPGRAITLVADLSPPLYQRASAKRIPPASLRRQLQRDSPGLQGDPTAMDYRLWDLVFRARTCLRKAGPHYNMAPVHLRPLPSQKAQLRTLPAAGFAMVATSNGMLVPNDAFFARYGAVSAWRPSNEQFAALCPPSDPLPTFANGTAAADVSTFVGSVADEVAFLLARWGGLNPWHATWDPGAFQLWLFWRRVFLPWWQAADDSTSPPAAASDPTAAPIIGPTVDFAYDPVRPMDDLPPPGSWERRMGASPPPVHEWWWRSLRPRDGMLFEVPGRRCRRFQVLATPKHTFHGRGRRNVDFLSDAMLAHARRFVNDSLLGPLLAAHGDVAWDAAAPVLVAERRLLPFNVEHRSRGMSPAVEREILASVVPLLSPASSPASNHTIAKVLSPSAVARRVRRVAFKHATPTKSQLHAIRRARVVLCGEGAFQSWAPLSQPGTTWVVVYNHTHTDPHGDFKFTSYHAPLLRAFPWLRTIHYVVDHGRGDTLALPDGRLKPDSALRAFFDGRRPWAPGVFFVGADAHGHRPAE